MTTDPIVIAPDMLAEIKAELGTEPLDDFTERYNDALREGLSWGNDD